MSKENSSKKKEFERGLEAEVLIVGSGFAASILARALASHGRDVLIVEKGSHPRFALGESTTPLANLALERIARRFGWEDLWTLANWGRWQRNHPGLRCGLKRGFAFFDQACGSEPGKATSSNPVLVAASPNDHVADTHWLRADVDDYLLQQALKAGARYLDETEIVSLEIAPEAPSPVRAVARGSSVDPDRPGHTVQIQSQFLVDASGAQGLCSRLLELPQRDALPFRSSLLFSHFQGLHRPTVVSKAASAVSPPFPPEWSAVHHCLDVGWMYELRFDADAGVPTAEIRGAETKDDETRASGELVSCGWVLDHRRVRQLGLDAELLDPILLENTDVGKRNQTSLQLHQRLLRRYPGLAARFEDAVPVRPVASVPSLQWRLEQGPGWPVALLPQAFAFYDPMFSTGIAWSLLAVERLCDLLLQADPEQQQRAKQQSLMTRYERLMTAEANHIETLLSGAYEVLHSADDLGWFAQSYFALASFSETRQRIVDPPSEGWHWCGFLGAGDPVAREIVSASLDLVRCDPQSLRKRMNSIVAPWNVAGLADFQKHPNYPADVQTVVDAAPLLGLSPSQVQERLPRLMGNVAFEAD